MTKDHEFAYRLTVRPDDIDELNHVHNIQYLRWTNQAAVAHSTRVGWPTARYRETGRGFIVRTHNIQYRVPAQLDDAITVLTWIEQMHKASCLRKYRILRESDGQLLARAETTWVFVDLASLQLLRIPEEISAAFPLP